MVARDIEVLLTRELRGLGDELDLFPDDASVWTSFPGVSNPAGNLALHVAGNVRHFVGAVLGGTGYRRDRESEFGRRSGSRRELRAELEDAARTVGQVLHDLPDDRLDAAFPNLPVDGDVTTRRFLMHLAVHAGYHLGQVGYLRRIVTGDGRTSGALGFGPLRETGGS